MTTVKPCPHHERILARVTRHRPHLDDETRKRLARDLARACPDCQDPTTSLAGAWTPTPHLPRDQRKEKS